MSVAVLSRPARPRRRRSQAERSAETRARVIRAVVECIDDLGFRRATASEIGRRAGVTWGAVQHHFGGKKGILTAVLDDSFGRFARRFDDLGALDARLEERASLFVDRAWEHFSSPHYRSTFEILLHWLPEHDAGVASAPQRRMLAAWDQLWTRLFTDWPLPHRRRLALEIYTVSALSGLALNRVLQGRDGAVPQGSLAILKASIVRELQGAARRRAANPDDRRRA